MKKGYEFTRDFVAKFVEEAEKRPLPVHECLFWMPGWLLEKFARLVEIPEFLIKRFAETHDGYSEPPRHLFYAPPSYAMLVRREVVLAILEKVGR